MGQQGDIMRVEAVVMMNSGLSYEQWVKNYAEKYRRLVNEAIQRTGKVPTADQVERILYHG